MKIRKKESEQEANEEISKSNTGAPIAEFYTNSIFIYASPYNLELQHLLVDSLKNFKSAIKYSRLYLSRINS